MSITDQPKMEFTRLDFSRFTDTPPLGRWLMRLTLDHWALQCASCARVFVVSLMEGPARVWEHVRACNLLTPGTLDGLRARIREYAGNADVEARSVALLDRLWNRFGADIDRRSPRWFVTATGDGAIQIELDFDDDRSSEVIIEPDGGFVLYEHRPVTEVVEHSLSTLDEVVEAVHAPSMEGELVA